MSAPDRKEQLAQALRDYPTWGDAYLAVSDELAAAREAGADYAGYGEILESLTVELAAAREREQTLREALGKHRKQCPGSVEFMDGRIEPCPACAALAATEEQV